MVNVDTKVLQLIIYYDLVLYLMKEYSKLCTKIDELEHELFEEIEGDE